MQRVSGTTLPGAGAYWVPVDHAGNSQKSDEEVDA